MILSSCILHGFEAHLSSHQVGAGCAAAHATCPGRPLPGTCRSGPLDRELADGRRTTAVQLLKLALAPQLRAERGACPARARGDAGGRPPLGARRRPVTFGSICQRASRAPAARFLWAAAPRAAAAQPHHAAAPAARATAAPPGGVQPSLRVLPLWSTASDAGPARVAPHSAAQRAAWHTPRAPGRRRPAGRLPAESNQCGTRTAALLTVHQPATAHCRAAPQPRAPHDASGCPG